MPCLRSLLATLLVLIASRGWADVRLPKILASGMVLQRESEVKLWGWAEPGEAVRVAADWFDQPLAATADADGRWQVSVKTGKAGGPHTLTISGKNEIKLDDVLFGEVWIGSGQSNMEMPLVAVSSAYTGIENAEQEVAAADYPQIRLFQAGNFSSREPLEDVEPGIVMYGIPAAACRWQACAPETVKHFSSTAYFFARHLHKELNVPIGIIDASWGGTQAEAWTPADGLKKLGYDAELQQAATAPQQPDGKIPARLYNGMIHPLRNFRIRGVIWYQGEGNVSRAEKYLELFSTMIGEWRAAFGYEFPFYFVQISPYNYGQANSALLRAAQFQTLVVPRTGMAVTLDIGNLKDIHPKNKQEVGRRLALWALAKDYGRDVVPSGPLFKSAAFSDGKAVISFDYADGGLATRDGQPPSHCELAGPDGVFHPAAATIDGDKLVLTSDKVPTPVAARYAFSNDAEPNLTNKAGLPASSFRAHKIQL